MKREEKTALARQRILDAAMQEFSEKGYEGASLNTACAAHDISKGILYHHFKDKDELYVQCVTKCFDALTAYLQEAAQGLSGTVEQRLRGYFDARLRFFAQHPLYLGVFADAAFRPPVALGGEIAVCRRAFDELNISMLTSLVRSRPLRAGLCADMIVEDFRLYMDFFNMRFRMEFRKQTPSETVLQEHEERCHRQLNMLLYGVWGEDNAEA